MPAQNDIALLINASLKANNFKSQRFQSGAYFGIAEPIKEISEDGEKTAPYIIDDTGEGTTVVYNDTCPFTVFHRLETPEYNIPVDDYGKPGTTMQETSNMRLVFTGSRGRMKIRPENVAAAIAMDFPKEFTPAQITSLGLNSCIIEMGSVIVDPYTVWSQEWIGHEYDLDTDTIMISVNYRIVSTYNKLCFSLCQ